MFQWQNEIQQQKLEKDFDFLKVPQSSQLGAWEFWSSEI